MKQSYPRRGFVRLSLAMTLAAACMGEVSANAGAPSPVGVWEAPNHKTGKLESLIEVYPKAGKLHGKIIKLIANPSATCAGCKGQSKGKSLLGMTIMWDFEQDDDKWESGRILDPETGKTYRCKIWLDGPNVLKVRAYFGPFYQTETWKRR